MKNKFVAAYNRRCKAEKHAWNFPCLELILNHGKTAKISPEDYEIVRRNGPWCAQKSKNTFYAYGKRNNRNMGLHRLIMGFPPYPEFEVDHKNGDGLDNRRCNLEVVTGAENRRRAVARKMAKGAL